jgi:putative transposase
MNIMAIYPKRNLSKLGHAKYIHPYLLRNLKVERPNQVWTIDITYIPMKSGFMYLTAIIDAYSRYVVGWCNRKITMYQNRKIVMCIVFGK